MGHWIGIAMPPARRRNQGAADKQWFFQSIFRAIQQWPERCFPEWFFVCCFFVQNRSRLVAFLCYRSLDIIFNIGSHQPG